MYVHRLFSIVLDGPGYTLLGKEKKKTKISGQLFFQVIFQRRRVSSVNRHGISEEAFFHSDYDGITLLAGNRQML